MNKIIKVILIFALSMILIITTSILVSAHTQSQSDILQSNIVAGGSYGSTLYVGGESIGWSIDENYHNGSSYLYFKWKPGDSCLTNARKVSYLRGAQKWYPCGIVREDSTLAEGIFGTMNKGSFSPTIAQFYDYKDKADDNGHLEAGWKIDMNIAKSYSDAEWAVLLAHEMGHAYGLNDLYEDSNKNKLMYAYDDGTATGPTSSDVKGFNVITGRHSSHSFNSSGVCTVCGGLEK